MTLQAAFQRPPEPPPPPGPKCSVRQLLESLSPTDRAAFADILASEAWEPQDIADRLEEHGYLVKGRTIRDYTIIRHRLRQCRCPADDTR